MTLPRKPQPTQAAHISPQTAGTIDIEPWPDNDAELPGNAVCPACKRPLYEPSASAVLDLLLVADQALGTAQQCVKRLKDVVETAVPS